MKHDYQKLFLDAVLGSEVDSTLLANLRPAGNLSKLEAVNVYRGDYTARMQEALGKNYEATWVLLGDEEFKDATSRYIKSYPSTYTNLTAYGESFPEFLAQEYEADVVTMADFEKKFWKLFNQKANPVKVILPEEISSLSFELGDSIYLFQSSFQLYQLWQKREEAGAGLSFSDFDTEQFLAMFKEGEKVSVKELTSQQYNILQCFRKIGSWEQTLNEIQIQGYAGSTEDWALVFEILSYSRRNNRVK